MIDGRLSEFLDLLYMGEELVFEYHNVKYFLQGWSSEGQARMVLDKVSETAPFKEYFWEFSGKTMIECADAFLKANIWEEKRFLQIENEIRWSDW